MRKTCAVPLRTFRVLFWSSSDYGVSHANMPPVPYRMAGNPIILAHLLGLFSLGVF
jgi:hypothetical protein